MNNLLTKSDIERFLHRLGERLATEETLYLIGGSALLRQPEKVAQLRTSFYLSFREKRGISGLQTRDSSLRSE